MTKDNLPCKKITLDKPEGRRRVGRPNLRWMDGVMRDAERLGVRNWRSKAKDRVGWRRLLESAKTLLNDFKWQMYYKNDRFVTFYNKCSKIPPSTSVHVATAVRKSHVFRLGWSSRFFMGIAAFKMRGRSSSRRFTSILQNPLSCQSHKQKS